MGLYYLTDGGVIQAILPKVAVGFSLLANPAATPWEPTSQRKLYVMHKHGSPEIVLSWLRCARDKYISRGALELADELWAIVSDRWDVTDLNKILEIEGYLGAFLEKIFANDRLANQKTI
jgi:hypothetical protein